MRRHWFSVYGRVRLRSPVCVRCEAPNPRPLTEDEWAALTDYRKMGGRVGVLVRIAMDKRAAEQASVPVVPGLVPRGDRVVVVAAPLSSENASIAFGHNHVTRDVKPPGVCPACDEYHASQEPAAEPSSARYEVRRVYGPQQGTHGVYDTVTHTWVHLRGLGHMTEAEAVELQHQQEFGEPVPVDRTRDDGPASAAGVPYLVGDDIVKNWHHRGP